MKRKGSDQTLTQAIVDLASKYGRYGYRRITALLRENGWSVNHKRVERIWRQEGLKVPKKHPKRSRLWLNGGSCVRKCSEYKNHVWAYDFVQDRTHEGKRFRMLTVIDEYSRECLAVKVNRSLKSIDVIETWLTYLYRRVNQILTLTVVISMRVPLVNISPNNITP